MVRASGSAIRRGEVISAPTTTTSSPTNVEIYGGRIPALRGSTTQIKQQLQAEIARLEARRQAMEELKKNAKGINENRKYRKRIREYNDRIATIANYANNLDRAQLTKTSSRARVYMAIKGTDDYDKAKRVAAYTYAERAERSAERTQERNVKIQANKAGITGTEFDQLNPQAYRAVRQAAQSGALRRAGVPDPRPTTSYKTSIGGKNYIGTQDFIKGKVRASQQAALKERFTAYEQLNKQGFTASDFFPRAPVARLGAPTTLAGLSLQTLGTKPAPRPARVSKETIAYYGLQRRAERISARRDAFFSSEGFEAISDTANIQTQPWTLGGRRSPIIPYEERSFAGKTAQKAVFMLSAAPLAVGGIIPSTAQSLKLARDVEVYERRFNNQDPLRFSTTVSKELYIDAPRRTIAQFDPRTPEGLASTLVSLGTAGLGAYGIAASRGLPPPVKAPQGNLRVTTTGASPRIQSANLVPEARISGVTTIRYGTTTKGVFPRRVETTTRLGSEGGATTSQLIGNTRYTTTALANGRNLVTATRNGALVSQRVVKGGAGDFIDFTALGAKYTLTNQQLRPNQLVNKGVLETSYLLSGRLGGKPLLGDFDTLTISGLRVNAPPARMTYAENVFGRNVRTGEKALVAEFSERSLAPVRIRSADAGEGFPKVFSRSERESLGVRISPEGELFTDIVTRTRRARLNMDLRSMAIEDGSGLARVQRPRSLASSRGGQARPSLSMSKSRPEVLKVKAPADAQRTLTVNRGGQTRSSLRITRRRPEILEVKAPITAPRTLRGGLSRRSLPRTQALTRVAPVLGVSFAPLTASASSLTQRGGLRTSSRSRLVTSQRPSLLTSQRSSLLTSQRPTTRTAARTATRTSTRPFSFPTPFPAPLPRTTTPPPIIPLGGAFGFLKGRSGKQRKNATKGAARGFGYAPSLPAIDLGITGRAPKPPRGFTGFEFRPLRRGVL